MPDEGKCSSHCEEGPSYAGYDLGKKSVPDLDACFEHCKNNPQTKFLNCGMAIVIARRLMLGERKRLML